MSLNVLTNIHKQKYMSYLLIGLLVLFFIMLMMRSVTVTKEHLDKSKIDKVLSSYTDHE